MPGKRLPTLLLLAGLAASILAPAFDGNGFAEKFDALPKAVKATATAHMENAFPLSITSAKGEQGWDYQINTLVNGKHHNIVIDGAGKLIALKDETDLASLPAPAKAALEKQAATARILSLEKITEGNQVTWGAIVKDEAAGSVTQLRVASNGVIQPRP